MIKQILMPDAGQTTDAAIIVKIYVEKGRHVNRGDLLVDVETDKATLTIESFTAGIVIDLLHGEGDEVRSGDVIALIGDEADLSGKDQAPLSPAVEKYESKATEIADDPEENNAVHPLVIIPAMPEPIEKQQAPDSAGTIKKAMPNAKKLARELGIDIHTVTSSNDLFVTASDVEGYHKRQAATVESQEYTVLPITNMRSVIGSRMLESVQQIPSFTATIKVDMTAAIALKKSFQEELSIKITYNDLIAKGLAVAAKKYQLINARYENGEIRVFKHTNIGLAVEVDGGLLVPVVRNVDLLGIAEIAAANQVNIENARAGRLLPGSLAGGSTTISNLGMYDIYQFTAIINPPESCILAVGKIEYQPVWRDDDWKPVPLMMITASFDHRMIDGGYGAQLLSFVKKVIEHPILFLT